MKNSTARIGYARVSTVDQNLDAQIAALEAAGCTMIRTENRDGATLTGRRELGIILDFIHQGETLVVTRIDRLARSMHDLQVIVATLKVPWVDVRTCMGSWTPRSLTALTNTDGLVLPSTTGTVSALRKSAISSLISPAHAHRYRRFAHPLAGTDARLAAKVARYTFLSAGLAPAVHARVSLAHPRRHPPARPRRRSADPQGSLPCPASPLSTSHTYIVLAQKPIRVILINELGSRSDGEVCAVATRSSVGRSLSLV